MRVAGLCAICGKKATPAFTCILCGRLVCRHDYSSADKTCNDCMFKTVV